MAVAESLEPLAELVGAIRMVGRVSQVQQQSDGAIISLWRRFHDPRRDMLPNGWDARRYVFEVPVAWASALA